MNIYLAGKIDRDNDWREKLVNNIRIESNSVMRFPRWPIRENVLWGNNYTGPFFVMTPNAKYGEQHGSSLSNHKMGDPDQDPFLKSIRDNCLRAIIDADIVFAYINSFVG